MTSADARATRAATPPSPPPPPPPPPAEIKYTGEYSVNPLGEVSFRKLCAQLPAVLRRIAKMSWDIDRRAVLLLLACQR